RIAMNQIPSQFYRRDISLIYELALAALGIGITAYSGFNYPPEPEVASEASAYLHMYLFGSVMQCIMQSMISSSNAVFSSFEFAFDFRQQMGLQGLALLLSSEDPGRLVNMLIDISTENWFILLTHLIPVGMTQLIEKLTVRVDFED